MLRSSTDICWSIYRVVLLFFVIEKNEGPWYFKLNFRLLGYYMLQDAFRFFHVFQSAAKSAALQNKTFTHEKI